MRFTALVLTAVLALFCSTSQAQTVTLDNVRFDDGTMAVGWFVLDQTTVTDWNIDTATYIATDYRVNGQHYSKESLHNISYAETYFTDLGVSFLFAPARGIGVSLTLAYTLDQLAQPDYAYLDTTQIRPVSGYGPANTAVDASTEYVDRKHRNVTSGGSFISQSTGTVPEPGTWMTMLAGVAMLGWFARRRMA